MPPAGVGSVTVLNQTIDNTAHRLGDGSVLHEGASTDSSILVEGEDAFTDRFSMTANLPFVFARYRGPGLGPFGVLKPVDACHCWHRGIQDIGVTARYNIVTGAFALTPSIALGVPSHHYDYEGEAVLGRDLREVRLGVDAGRRLDRVSPRLSVQGAYSYAIVQRVLDIPNNRSNASIGAGFAVTRRFSAHTTFSWQRTHGGLRLGPPDQNFGEVNTPERRRQHDRLLRDNYFHAGGGAAYSFAKFDLFGSWIEYVGGTTTHEGRVFTFGVTVPFERTLRRP